AELHPDGGPSSSYYVALARFQLQMRDFAKAENSLKEALHASYENPDVWALTGHLHYLNNKFRKARKSYERTLDFVRDACEMHTVCLRLGSIYLLEKELGELEEAEDALSEANIMNNRNPEVWGYLTLICLQVKCTLIQLFGMFGTNSFNDRRALSLHCDWCTGSMHRTPCPPFWR
uniref:Cilia and flagella associated protein 70 n=1 Tax=Erpetoichthys calabaricus TaxID=27687 RepID=A0A8C4SF97_ERPCA